MSRENAQEFILLTPIGLCPAVLTETIRGLAREDTPIIPDRVIAFTTAPERDALFERRK